MSNIGHNYITYNYLYRNNKSISELFILFVNVAYKLHVIYMCECVCEYIYILGIYILNIVYKTLTTIAASII